MLGAECDSREVTAKHSGGDCEYISGVWFIAEETTHVSCIQTKGLPDCGVCRGYPSLEGDFTASVHLIRGCCSQVRDSRSPSAGAGAVGYMHQGRRGLRLHVYHALSELLRYPRSTSGTSDCQSR
jgi:hypothetical protein